MLSLPNYSYSMTQINLRQMSLQHLFVFLPLLVLCEFACPNRYQILPSNCILLVEFTDSSCTVFDNMLANWQDCSYSKNPKQHKCGSASTISTSIWELFLDQCCEQIRGAPKNIDSIMTCKNGPEVMMTIIAISITCSLVTIVIFFLFLCCCCPKRLCGCLLTIRESIAKTGCCLRPRNQVSIAQNPSSSCIIFIEKEWTEMETEENLEKSTICSICLDEDVTIQLECQHLFHKKCILTWLMRREECTLCRKAGLKHIRIYCERCFKWYYQASLESAKSSVLFADQICPRCTKISEEIIIQ